MKKNLYLWAGLVALALLLLMATASAQSVVYTVGPLPKARVHLDTVTAKVAVAALKHVDSSFHVEVVDNGDVNGDGRLSSADIIYLKNYILTKGPAPKAHIVFETVAVPIGKDSVSLKLILVDSSGVTLP